MDEEKQKTNEPIVAKNEKKSPLTIILVIVGIVILAVIATSFWACKSFSNFFKKNVIDNDTNKTISVSSTSGTETFSQSTTWPTDVPSTVPKFSDGTIAYSYKNDTTDLKGWVIGINSVSKTQYDTYLANLISAGWTQTDQIDAGLVVTTMLEKGEYSIQYVFDPSTNGVMLTIIQK